MKQKQQFEGWVLDHKITLNNLYLAVKTLKDMVPDADTTYVTLRQVEGTDFPPFLSVENDELNINEYDYIELW